MGSIYISYAWKDRDQNMNESREHIVNELCKAFEQKGYHVMRDKTDMGYRDRISEFMKNIAKADVVISVISNKYLYSPFCMYEITGTWENGKFSKRIFPIILDDAICIFDKNFRVDLVNHWIKEYTDFDKKVSTISKNSARGGFSATLQELEFINSRVSDAISTIVDMLGKPSKELLETQFQEIATQVEEYLRIKNTHKEQEPNSGELQKVKGTPLEKAKQLTPNSTKNIKNFGATTKGKESSVGKEQSTETSSKTTNNNTMNKAVDLSKGVDCIVLVDASSSMHEEDVYSNDRVVSRWELMQEWVKGICAELIKIDSDGIDVIFFSGTPHDKVNAKTYQQIKNLFRINPSGDTNLLLPLQKAITMLLERGFERPRLIIVITDGHPEVGSKEKIAIESLIVKTAQKIAHRRELSILFIQIGLEKDCANFLNDLDNNIAKKNKIIDIVATKTYDEAVTVIQNFGFLRLIEDAFSK